MTPLFIICHARSGSTLLGRILNAHPDVFCPPELHLASLIAEYLRAADVACRRPPDSACDPAAKLVRDGIDQFTGSLAAQHGKRIWCEKSVYTLQRIKSVLRVYRDAAYITLYRHPMDFICSAREIVATQGIHGYGFTRYLAAPRCTSVPDALAKVWCDHVEAAMLLEREQGGATIRVKYELLVAQPEESLSRLFGFLKLDLPPSLVADAFARPHLYGPGDFKIIGTKKIATASVGTGRTVPASALAKETLARVNRLCEVLEYEPISREWNDVGHRRFGENDAESQAFAASKACEVFEQYLAARLRSVTLSVRQQYIVHILDVPGSMWLIERGAVSRTADDRRYDGAFTVRMDFVTMLRCFWGQSTLVSAVSSGHAYTSDDDARPLAELSKLFQP